MAAQPTPTTWQELFDNVFEESVSKLCASNSEFESYIADRIKQGQQHFSFMQGNIAKDYCHCHCQKLKKQVQRSREASGPSGQQFWQSAHDFNPLARHDSDLVVNCLRVKPIFQKKTSATILPSIALISSQNLSNSVAKKKISILEYIKYSLSSYPQPRILTIVLHKSPPHPPQFV